MSTPPTQGSKKTILRTIGKLAQNIQILAGQIQSQGSVMMEMVAAINLLIDKGLITREELTASKIALIQKHSAPRQGDGVQSKTPGPDGSSG